MTHTPGTWWIDGGRGFNAPIVMAGEPWPGKNRHIAKVLYESGSEDNEVEGNAHLIAAAPALLIACQLAVKFLHKMRADGVQTALPVTNAIRLVEGAINKAKGA